MHIKRKINFYKYFFFFFLWLMPTLWLARNNSEIIAMLLVALATVLNQFMLVEAISGNTEEHNQKKKMITLFVAKMLILFGALFYCGHLMGSRVIIPLIYFVLMIFSLAYSIRKS